MGSRGAQDAEPDLVLAEAELEGGSAVMSFDPTNDSLWPIGSYSLEVYLNGQLSITLRFEVR